MNKYTAPKKGAYMINGKQVKVKKEKPLLRLRYITLSLSKKQRDEIALSLSYIEKDKTK
jgi:hypothetical protein